MIFIARWGPRNADETGRLAARPFMSVKGENPWQTARKTRQTRGVDMKVEIVVIPVLDVSRQGFYAAWVGGGMPDCAAGDDWRVIQSNTAARASVSSARTSTAAGARALPRECNVIVSDLKAVRDGMLARGVGSERLSMAANVAPPARTSPICPALA